MRFHPVATIRPSGASGMSDKSVSRLQCRRFVVAVHVPDTLFKVFQIIFSKSDGSLFVSIPYSSLPQGILTGARLPRGVRETKVHLEERGRLTTNRVKYAHHPDGRAHFSQHGKVRAQVGRQSTPLTDMRGHIFTLQAQGLRQFEAEARPKEQSPSSRRTLIAYNFEHLAPLAVKFTGWWYHVDELARRTSSGPIGPKITTQKPEGNRVPSFILGPLLGEPLANYCLVITCETIPLMDPTQPYLLTILGGFGDAPVLDPLADQYFLCLNYPVSNFETLRRTIGSIDIQPDDSYANAA